jgi:type 1 fimbria pilin
LPNVAIINLNATRASQLRAIITRSPVISAADAEDDADDEGWKPEEDDAADGSYEGPFSVWLKAVTALKISSG